MKVLIWCCDFEEQFAGPFVYNEAKRQGCDVRIVGTRKDPSLVMPMVKKWRPDWVLSFVVRPNYARVSASDYTSEVQGIYRTIRQAGARLAFWYPDQCESRRDAMIKKLRGAADLFIFSIKHTAMEYADLAPKVVWVPQYFDAAQCTLRDVKIDKSYIYSQNAKHDYISRPLQYQPLPLRLDPSKEQWDVIFLGSVDRRRRRWLEELKKKYKVLSHVTRTPSDIRGREMAEAYAQSRIAINIQREIFLNSGPFITSNRMYNAMGCGCFLLQHRMTDLGLLFEEGRHCVTYDDTFEDMTRKIGWYLNDETGRETIALAGQAEVLRNHTLEQRIPQYWKLMEDYDNDT